MANSVSMLDEDSRQTSREVTVVRFHEELDGEGLEGKDGGIEREAKATIQPVATSRNLKNRAKTTLSVAPALPSS